MNLSDEKKGGYVLGWSSGHVPPKTVYYCRDENGWGGGTYERDKAMVFRSRRAAENQWRQLSTFPEDYEHCLLEGSARAEHVTQPALIFIQRTQA